MNSDGKLLFSIISSVVGLCIAIFIFTCLHVVPTGYTGVLVSNGKIGEKTYSSGEFVFTAPFAEKLLKVNNKQQDYVDKEQIWGETNDQTPVYAQNVIVTYQIQVEGSVYVASNTDLKLMSDSFIASAVKSAMVELTPAQVTNRAYIEPLALEKIEEACKVKYGPGIIAINKVTIEQMDFEPAYNEIIQKKSIANQTLEIQKIKGETEVYQAENNKKITVLNAEAQKEVALADAEAQKAKTLAEAEAEAEAVRITAEAEANKIKIIAQAEAEANKMLDASLSENLLRIKAIEAWDGKLPNVNAGSTSFSSLIGIESE